MPTKGKSLKSSTASTRTGGAQLTSKKIAGVKPAKNTLNKSVKSTRGK